VRGHSVSDFLAAYPEYAAASRLDELRATEYSYLDAGGHVYLDYTGSGLAADAQLRAYVQRLRGGCFGNPGSAACWPGGTRIFHDLFLAGTP
jgi:hypothetical protein